MTNPSEITRQLYPTGINVYRVKSDGIHTVVQYEYQGKRYHSVNNLEKVLYTTEVNAFWPCCFYRGDLLVVYGYKVRKSDPFLVFQQPFMELKPETSMHVITDTGFQYEDIEPTLERIYDITVDYDPDCNTYNLLVAFESFVNTYQLYNEFFSQSLPTSTISFKGKRLYSIHSLSTKFALFYDLIPPLNETRLVDPTNNITNPPLAVVDNSLVLNPNPPNPLQDYKVWNRIVITYNDHSRALLYDTERKTTLRDWSLGPFTQSVLITDITTIQNLLTYTMTTLTTTTTQDISYQVQITTKVNNITTSTITLPATVDNNGISYLLVASDHTVTPSTSNLDTPFTLHSPYNETNTVLNAPNGNPLYHPDRQIPPTRLPQQSGDDAILLTRILKQGINPSISDEQIVRNANVSDFLTDLTKDPLVFNANGIRFTVPTFINMTLAQLIAAAQAAFIANSTDLTVNLVKLNDLVIGTDLNKGGWYLVFSGTNFTRLLPGNVNQVVATLIPTVSASSVPIVTTVDTPVEVDSIGNVYLIIDNPPNAAPIITVTPTYQDATHTIGLSTSYSEAVDLTTPLHNTHINIDLSLNTINTTQPITTETRQQIVTIDSNGRVYFVIFNQNETLITNFVSSPITNGNFVTLNTTFLLSQDFTSIHDTKHVSIIVSLVNNVLKNRKSDFFYYPHKQYNPWRNLSIFRGDYTEDYNYTTGQWTQSYTDVNGVFDWRYKIFDLTTDLVDNDGFFTRSSTISQGVPHHVTVTLSNVNLLNHFYLIFRIVVEDEFNIPVPFARVTAEIVAGDTDGQALRYFDPKFDGVPVNSDLTDLDGTAFVLLRTVNGDFPEQLQGHWAFSIKVSKSNPITMEDAISFEGYKPTSALGMITDMLKVSDDLDFLRCRKQFHFDL
jgi:hypothetical protein